MNKERKGDLLMTTAPASVFQLQVALISLMVVKRSRFSAIPEVCHVHLGKAET